MTSDRDFNCRQAEMYYLDYLFGQTAPAESSTALEHIRQCPRCQHEVKRLEQEINTREGSPGDSASILALHHRLLSAWVDCDVVRPFLILQAHRQLSLSTQTPVTAHLAQCQACQQDLQALVSLELSGSQLADAGRVLAGESQNGACLSEQVMAVLYRIQTRSISGIVTRLQIDDRGQIHAQVRHACRPEMTRRYLFMRCTAAAGILMVASLVLLMTTRVGGVSIQDVYGSIQSISNCKIEIRDADARSYHQKLLICRSLNLVLSQRHNETVILDFRSERLLKSTPQGGITTEVSKSTLAAMMKRPDFGLLPFDSITAIPAGYRWKRLDTMSKDGDNEVYELSWVDSGTAAGPIERVWRGHLLRHSHLPIRIEWLENRADGPQELITETIIGYPDTQELLRELRTDSLYQSLEGDQIK